MSSTMSAVSTADNEYVGRASPTKNAYALMCNSTVKGTPAFMAPELFRLGEDDDDDDATTSTVAGTAEDEEMKGFQEELKYTYEGPPIDVWSLGAALFMMVTGHPPWVAKNEIELARMVVHNELRFPLTTAPPRPTGDVAADAEKKLKVMKQSTLQGRPYNQIQAAKQAMKMQQQGGMVPPSPRLGGGQSQSRFQSMKMNRKGRPSAHTSASTKGFSRNGSTQHKVSGAGSNWFRSSKRSMQADPSGKKLQSVSSSPAVIVSREATAYRAAAESQGCRVIELEYERHIRTRNEPLTVTILNYNEPLTCWVG
jgi:serine/threonine protein kinase